jgi:hypothetical protein
MNCTLAAQALDSLMRTTYGDSLAIVEWHPYATDTMNINPDDSLRVAGYQHNKGQPSLVLDGYQAVAMPSDPSEFYETFDAAIRAVKSTAAYVALTVTGEADTVEGRVIVTLAMDSITPGSSPTLYCVVTEDSLLDQLGGAYFRVPAQFLPDRNGMPVSLARGDTLVDTLTFATAGHRLDMLGAAVFVEDASGTEEHRVLQSATINRFVLTEDK